ncbi:MAG: LPS export ABC transporter permease LptG [Pseudorhodoplanes sp.]
MGMTLSRYFGMRFLNAALATFAGILILVAVIDYIELMRRTADLQGVSALTVAQTSLFRVPQVAERVLPFCVLIGAMSCFLTLSRRLELVVARASGLSAWGFIAPALIVAFVLGIVATTIYNPVSSILRERSKRLEAEIFKQDKTGLQMSGNNYWLRQRAPDGHQSILNAAASQEQGLRLSGITVFVFDPTGKYEERIEAKAATLEAGHWRLTDARIYVPGSPPADRGAYLLPTALTPEQVRESFATPETVPFWQLPSYIDKAERSGLIAAGYRLQYQKLLSRPFLLASMVLLAAVFSLRFFRFGGVQKMVLGGVGAGFLLYVFIKITEDLGTAELIHPVVAAWLPVFVGGLTGLVALLYQEDG